jgi:hypothetical protein
MTTLGELTPRPYYQPLCWLITLESTHTKPRLRLLQRASRCAEAGGVVMPLVIEAVEGRYWQLLDYASPNELEIILSDLESAEETEVEPADGITNWQRFVKMSRCRLRNTTVLPPAPETDSAVQ